MRIVYICSSYSPLVGGVETHAKQVAQWMSKNHHVCIAVRNFSVCPQSDMLALFHENVLTPPWPDTQDDGIPVYSLTPTFFTRLLMCPILIRAIPKLRRWFYHSINRFTHYFYHLAISHKLEPIICGADVVHLLAHGDLGWSTAIIARKFGVPLVCTPFVHPKQWGDGPNDKRLYQRCNAVIGLVKTDAKYLVSLGVQQTNVKVVGVSPNLPESASAARFREKYSLIDKHIVLYVGRMMAQKGASVVVEAARLAEQNSHSYAFVFVGPSSEDERAIFIDAPSSVIYLGRLDLQDKADAYAACDVFCMPSTSEILPTVYLEAWCFAKPVVGGLADGLKDFVAGNDAGVNVAQDPDQVLAAIETYRLNPVIAKRHGRNGQQLVTNNYTKQSVGSKLEEIYRQVINESSITGSTSTVSSV